MQAGEEGNLRSPPGTVARLMAQHSAYPPNGIRHDRLGPIDAEIELPA